jgi:hypothetical protein
VRARRSAGGTFFQLERIGDVVEGMQPGKQRLAIILEHIAEIGVRSLSTVEQDLPGVGGNEARDHVDQRALAAAVRSEHRDQFAARNVEIEIVVDDGLVETFAHAADRHVCGGFARRRIKQIRRGRRPAHGAPLTR